MPLHKKKAAVPGHDKQAQWLACWKSAGRELEMLRRKKIRECDTAHAIACLDEAFKAALRADEQKPVSGLVQQQHYFKKCRQC